MCIAHHHGFLKRTKSEADEWPQDAHAHTPKIKGGACTETCQTLCVANDKIGQNSLEDRDLTTPSLRQLPCAQLIIVIPGSPLVNTSKLFCIMQGCLAVSIKINPS